MKISKKVAKRLASRMAHGLVDGVAPKSKDGNRLGLRKRLQLLQSTKLRKLSRHALEAQLAQQGITVV